MAELLKFRRGLQANLDSAAFAAGTIYVTTDEQAMYVDTYVTNKETGAQEEKRIRLSDIIQIPTYADWQNMAPPYSQTALYYIVEQNALIKYTGNGTTHSWKQINSTSQITADLSTLTGRVSTVEGNIADLSGDLTDLTGRVTTAEGEIDTLQSEMDAVEGVAAANATAIGASGDAANATGSLYARINKNAADIGTLNTNLSGVQGDVSGLADRMTAVEGVNTTQTTNITNLTNAVGAAADTSNMNTAFGRIKKLEETDVAHGERLTNVENKATTNAGNISQNATDIATNAGNITKNANDISAANGKISTLEGKMTTAESDITTLKSDVSTLKTDVDTLGDDLDTLEGTVSGLGTDLGDLASTVDGHTTTIGQHTTAIGQNASDISALQTRAGNIESTVSGINTQVGTNKTDIANLATRVGKNETDIADLVATAATKTELNSAVDDLNATINQRINAANAMTYIDGVTKYADLPTSNVKIGDTYVVLTGFTHDGETYYAGDMLVASGDETNGVITANLTWDHVETGYIDEHVPTLDAENGQIRLSTFNAGTDDKGNQGAITVEAKAGTSTTVTVSGNKITIGMEWDSFDPA